MSCLTRDHSLCFIIHIGCDNVNNTQEGCLFAARALCLCVSERLYLWLNIGDSERRATSVFNILLSMALREQFEEVDVICV